MFVDAKRHRVYAICGAGLVDVFEERAGSYQRIGHVGTAPGHAPGCLFPNSTGCSWPSAPLARNRRRFGCSDRAMTTDLPRAAAVVMATASAIIRRTEAAAFRPFDGTDAASPSRPIRSRSNLGRSNMSARQMSEADSPNVRLNYGFAKGWEAGLEGQTTHGFPQSARRNGPESKRLFSKRGAARGRLQDKPGPSIATEFGVLLPGINDQHGAGGRLAAIVSQRWEPVTVHINAAAEVTREQHADLFLQRHPRRSA